MTVETAMTPNHHTFPMMQQRHTCADASWTGCSMGRPCICTKTTHREILNSEQLVLLLHSELLRRAHQPSYSKSLSFPSS